MEGLGLSAPWARRTTGRFGSSVGPSTSGSRARPTDPTGTCTPTRIKPLTAAYLATPASGTGGADRGPGRGPRRWWRARTCRGRLRGRSVFALGAAGGGRCFGVDLSFRQLQHSRRIDDETGAPVPVVPATATALPFRDGTFDVVFCCSGRCSSSRHGDAGGRGARVLRYGGRFAFSVTYLTRWMSRRSTRAGRPGGVAVELGPQPYVEVEARRPRRGYVEHHRTLGDWVSLLAGAGLPDHRPGRTGVARGSRPGLGRVVAGAWAADPWHRDLRRRPAGPNRRRRGFSVIW